MAIVAKIEAVDKEAFADLVNNVRKAEALADFIKAMAIGDGSKTVLLVTMDNLKYPPSEEAVAALAQIMGFVYAMMLAAASALVPVIKELAGKNTHHIIEGTFKALGRTLAKAVKINKEYKNEIPSTKGVL